MATKSVSTVISENITRCYNAGSEQAEKVMRNVLLDVFGFIPETVNEYSLTIAIGRNGKLFAWWYSLDGRESCREITTGERISAETITELLY